MTETRIVRQEILNIGRLSYFIKNISKDETDERGCIKLADDGPGEWFVVSVDTLLSRKGFI